jgi:hypothetical protein
MPPTGGFDGNTGVADAHNLAWKLAFVTRGLAGAELLETYDAERRPICALTVEQAYTRYALRVDPSLPRDDLMPPQDDAAIELGATYRSTAVRAEGPPESPLDDPHARSWTVGARVPHVMLPGPGGPISTLDTAEEGFALLVEGERARRPGRRPRPRAGRRATGRRAASSGRGDRVEAGDRRRPGVRAASRRPVRSTVEKVKRPT